MLDFQAKDAGRKRSLHNKKSTAKYLEGAPTEKFSMESNIKIPDQFPIYDYSVEQWEHHMSSAYPIDSQNMGFKETILSSPPKMAIPIETQIANNDF
jgi:hypothetical protein